MHPVTVTKMPNHCTEDMDSFSVAAANIAAKIGADCVMGIVLEASSWNRIFCDITFDRPKVSHDKIAAAKGFRATLVGMSTVPRITRPMTVCVIPISNNKLRGELDRP